MELKSLDTRSFKKTWILGSLRMFKLWHSLLMLSIMLSTVNNVFGPVAHPRSATLMHSAAARLAWQNSWMLCLSTWLTSITTVRWRVENDSKEVTEIYGGRSREIIQSSSGITYLKYWIFGIAFLVFPSLHVKNLFHFPVSVLFFLQFGVILKVRRVRVATIWLVLYNYICQLRTMVGTTEISIRVVLKGLKYNGLLFVLS